MTLLTRENLNPHKMRSYAEWREFSRGENLYHKNQIRVLEFNNDSTICEAYDRGKKFQIKISAVGNEIRFACDCQEGKSKPWFCSHIVASTFALQDYIKQVAEKDWRYQMELLLRHAPPRPSQKSAKTPVALAASILFIGLETQKENNKPFHYLSISPYFLSKQEWAPIAQLMDSEHPQQDALKLLESHDDWHSQVKLYMRGAPVKPLNLSPLEQEFINILIEGSLTYDEYIKYTSFYYKPVISHKYLSLLSEMKVPIFRKHKEHFILLNVHNEPVELKVILSEQREFYALEAGVMIAGKAYTLSGKNLLIFDQSPPWLLAGTTLAPIANPEVLQFISYFPIKIPSSEAETFRQQFFKRLYAYLPITGEIIKWETICEHLIPRLYLSKTEESPLEVELRFAYGSYEFPSRGPRTVAEELVELPGQWGGIRVLRNEELERKYYQILTDPRFGLKRAGSDRPEAFQLRARTHPFDFLTKSIPALTEAGFEIYGEKNFAKINRYKPTISLNISSGIDWFDVQAVARYGDQQVSLNEIRQALKRGERYIKLADGSIGQIPEEWLERYRHLFALAEETESGLRVNNLQISLLDELLEEAETKQIDPEFYTRRERLKSFERIAEQPLPQGFRGELRLYQKSGYDWLHFLHEYGFGGILADDMGLGKTIQALAFLLSLKERGQLTSPVLLVVPKSLLGNWQREAERFAPDLRILEYTGQGRKKDSIGFENYDIVITTYGTMLRDIEVLRGYRFSYVILDESQAIKNPITQTSKAARLLRADHRLCLTGTPVENNVFELWSQFAFLNPGLLGNLDTFKSEFASAIERRDETSDPTMQRLRRLVYPFILRRTKEQVAPELPPRTERTIYIDFEPAQRKFYQKTLEYYRHMLLGMIRESENINNVRFKILEGLLRLRQACIHPRLIDPAYRGPSAKFELLLETLETLQSEGHKALVFSQFVQTLTLLRQEMEARNMVYAYLDGQTQNHQEQVDRFQNDPKMPFFLISLKAGGVGLNLTAADYVLHIDPWWNPAVEMQAADRVHRIGQEKPVFIYKFIARNTVEEKIMQLQERKRELVEQLISAESSFFKSLTPEDVQMLFS